MERRTFVEPRSVFSTLFLLFACMPVLSEDGFTALFNGKDLSGWTTKTGDWRVEEGTLVLKSAGDHIMKNSSYLWVEGMYGDFVLELDYMVTEAVLYGSLPRLGGRGAGANSGVFIRVEDRADPVQTGIEIQIGNVDPGGQLERGTVGGIFDLVPPKLNMHKPGEWNHYRITCKGSGINVELNGRETASADLNQWKTARQNPDGTPNKFRRPLKEFARRGYIGLQDHGTPAAFRNIRIKVLDR